MTIQFRMFLWRWLPVFIWMGVIFMTSHQPKATYAPIQPSSVITRLEITPPAVPASLGVDWDTIVGKAAHVILYGVLTLVVWRATRNGYKTFAISLLYALFDEGHQFFIAERTPRLFDIGVDMVATLLMLGAIRIGGRFGARPRLFMKRLQKKAQRVSKTLWVELKYKKPFG